MNEQENKALHWLIASSADPTKISATIKGFSAFIPAFSILLTLLGHPLPADSIAGTIDAMAIVATAVLSVVSAVYGLFGAVRKIYFAM